MRVEVESGGKRLIRVTDDGSGMPHDDALLAFERHATSKLRTADDLLSIATLGFRGEALPSIAAVSRLVLETRATEEEQGTRIEFAGGKLLSVKPAGAPVGTSISVGDIFYCVPARRKFLKSETTELGHIASLVTHYALAHPDRQFVLKTPSQEILNVAPTEQLADRVYQVFGRAALDELLEIPRVTAPVRAAITEPAFEESEEAGQLGISGFTSRPEVQRTNRNGIYIFVNRRLVRDRLILHAIGEAYRNIMPPNLFPAVLLFLEVPYEEVDVNVHPSKIEVRFRHPSFLHDFTRDAIRQALSHARPIPGFPAARPTAEAMAAQAAGAAAGGFAGPPRAVIPAAVASSATLVEGFELSGAPDRPLPQRFEFDSAKAIELGGLAAAPASTAATATAQEVPAALPKPEEISNLKPLGQVSNSFIVAVNDEGLWIIDQHVAHERVLFEQHLRARREGPV
ncbi:MAG: DNA mismatch repair endonuclease MutL, partial [Steroidobacteraceae bacterium]